MKISDEYLLDAMVDGTTNENLASTVRLAQYMHFNLSYSFLNTMDKML